MKQQNVRVQRKNTELKPNFTLICMGIAAVCLLVMPLLIFTYEERKSQTERANNSSPNMYFGGRGAENLTNSYYKGGRGRGLWMRNQPIRRKRVAVD